MLPFTIDLICDPSVHAAPGVNKHIVDQLTLNEGSYQRAILNKL